MAARKATMKQETVGERIRIAITKAGLSQAQVAEAVGRSEQSVRNWVADRNMPSEGQMARLADALEVDTGWLLTGKTGIDSPSVLTTLRDLRAGQRRMISELMELRRMIESRPSTEPPPAPRNEGDVNP
jgi:transcriptional regulator with XRE-family HTH domain